MKHANIKGFTLLEIIIVIIIIAVLASVAMPRLTSTLDYVKAREAINFIGSARSSLEACGLIGSAGADDPDYSECECSGTKANPAGDTCRNQLGVTLHEPKYFESWSVTTTVNNYTIEVVAQSPAVGSVFYDLDEGRIYGTGIYSKLGPEPSAP